MLKFALEGRGDLIRAVLAEIRDLEAEAHREIIKRGLTPIQTDPYEFTLVTFGMSRFMDGGKVDSPPGFTGDPNTLPDDPMKQIWPQHYGDLYWPVVSSLAETLRQQGFRQEFVVFADAQEIMPEQNDQQAWLDTAFDTLRPFVNVAIREGNELDRHGANGVLALQVKPTNPGNVLWASGDYDIAERPEPLPWGAYVDYHGDRDPEHADESGKQGEHWYNGYRDDAAGKWGIGAKRACVAGEPQCAASQKVNRWGDVRETSPAQIGDAARGFSLGSAGFTIHTENGCLSRPLDTVERACAVEALVQALTVPLEAMTAPYCHDTFACHPLKDAPLIDGLPAAGESVSKTVGDKSWTSDSNTRSGYQPEAKAGWVVVKRSGPTGNHLDLKRA